MFEAIVGLCLLIDPQICRDTLIPGYEASTQATCDKLLEHTPPDISAFHTEFSAGDIRCQHQGPVAKFIEAAPGVFVHRGIISDAESDNLGDVSNAAFVIGRNSVAMIDSGGSRQVAETFWRAVRSRTELPVRYVILTHMHPDHVLGASVFAQSGAEVVGHFKLPRALSDRAETYLTNFGRLIGAAQFLGTAVTIPETLVDTVAQIDLGGRILSLRAWPTAHTGADLTVGDPTSGILFTGDLMFHEHTPALDGAVLGWQQVLSDLSALPYDRIMPGHGGPILNWPQSAAGLVSYLEVLVDDTRAAIARGDSLGEAAETVAQSQSGAWELFDLFNPRNATVAFTELEWE